MTPRRTGIFVIAAAIVAAAIGTLPMPVYAQDAPKPAPPKSDAPQAKPGRDRWAVKTAADKDARKVTLKPVKSTVEKLLDIPRPSDFPLDQVVAKYQESRAEPAETTIYTVEADVVEYRLMPDGDYRVVIRGPSGQTMVLEMPDPDPKFTSPEGPFAYAIKAAREQFETRFHPERTAKQVAAHVKITGIGFFGRAYGKTPPPKSNLIQLHPVLNVEWMDTPTPEFTAAIPKPAPTTKP